jgi:polyisoprenoid-binding protein YceI
MIRFSIAAGIMLVATTQAFAVTQWEAKPEANSISWVAATSELIGGYCTTFTPDIAFDPSALAQSSVKVVIDMASCRTGVEDKDKLLPEAEWFNESKFSNAQFSATKFRALGGNKYAADGELTLKGVTRPLTLDFTLDISGADAHVIGTASIDRTHFGIGNHTTAAYVGPEVTVKIDLRAVKK